MSYVPRRPPSRSCSRSTTWTTSKGMLPPKRTRRRTRSSGSGSTPSRRRSRGTSTATIGFLDRFVESLVGPRPLVEPLPTKSEEGEDQYGVKLTDKQRESLLHC